MPSRPLDPDTALAIHLSAILGRNQFTSNPGPVIDELLETAGGRDDILLPEVSRWVGFYEGEYTMRLALALRERFELLEEDVALGRKRRDAPVHGSHNFPAPEPRMPWTIPEA